MRKQDKWNVQGEHAITGDGSHHIEAYKLPKTDQDTERRNFPGYEHSEVYTLADMIGEESGNREGQDTRGTTDTDLKTHKMGLGHGGQYTKIYQKHGKAHQ